MQTKILLDYEDERTADAVSKAVAPDNLKISGVFPVKTYREESRVVSTIECQTVGTLIATIDDLLSCISIAEKALQTAKRIR